jgi:hypothetical protein
MPVHIRRDLLFAILSHVRALEDEAVQPTPSLSERDFYHLDATPAEIIGHIDYLYQKGMISGRFELGSYGDRRLEQGSFAAGEHAQEQYSFEAHPQVEAAPDPSDVAPIDGAVDVEGVRLTPAGRAALNELEREGHAPEPSRLS